MPNGWASMQASFIIPSSARLLRQAAVGMLANPRLDPASLPFAKHWAAQPELAEPISQGQEQAAAA